MVLLAAFCSHDHVSAFAPALKQASATAAKQSAAPPETTLITSSPCSASPCSASHVQHGWITIESDRPPLFAFHDRIRNPLSRSERVRAPHPPPNASATPPSALTMTTTSGGRRQTVSSTKPTSASPKSPGPFTAVTHSGL